MSGKYQPKGKGVRNRRKTGTSFSYPREMSKCRQPRQSRLSGLSRKSVLKTLSVMLFLALLTVLPVTVWARVISEAEVNKLPSALQGYARLTNTASDRIKPYTPSGPHGYEGTIDTIRRLQPAFDAGSSRYTVPRAMLYGVYLQESNSDTAAWQAVKGFIADNLHSKPGADGRFGNNIGPMRNSPENLATVHGVDWSKLNREQKEIIEKLVGSNPGSIIAAAAALNENRRLLYRNTPFSNQEMMETALGAYGPTGIRYWKDPANRIPDRAKSLQALKCKDSYGPSVLRLGQGVDNYLNGGGPEPNNLMRNFFGGPNCNRC
jgi:hypothetical protein